MQAKSRKAEPEKSLQYLVERPNDGNHLGGIQVDQAKIARQCQKIGSL